jgi:copper chaperone
MIMQTATLNIYGMSCNGCVQSVKNALLRTAGVSTADVSLEENKAQVTFDEQTTNPAALAEAVSEAGYEASESNS